jgi:hypothetical protein
MGASIHINGTGSSVIDTVFVCRQTGLVPRRWIVGTAKALGALIQEEIEALAQGGLNATQGDIRCISYGHLTRLAVWNLRTDWKRERPTIERMAAVRTWYRNFGGVEAVLNALESDFASAPARQEWMPVGMVREMSEAYDDISF